MHKKEADIVAEAGNPGIVTIATNMAGRGTDIKLSQNLKDAGGLAIIGTERHDSRRVDQTASRKIWPSRRSWKLTIFVSLKIT